MRQVVALRLWLAFALAPAGVMAATPAGSPLAQVKTAAPAPATTLPPVATPVPQPASTAPAPSALLPNPSTQWRDTGSDPILAVADTTAPAEAFRSLIAAAVARAPSADEAAANRDVAIATKKEARAQLRPSLDLSMTSYRTMSRHFSDDPLSVIEQSRPIQRTDGLISLQQTLVDFGASSIRVAAASERLDAAAADIDDAEDQTALSAIAAWYDVFTFRGLVALSEALATSQADLRIAVQRRIKEGMSAEGDLPRVDSYIASAGTRLARFRRQLSNAEARFTQLVGVPPPPGLQRAPMLGNVPKSEDMARFASAETPGVRSAKSQAAALRQDYRATGADLLPNLSFGVDAGRYGIFETAGDYDVRARLTLRKRLWGGITDRRDQDAAKARGAVAHADKVAEEAARDASIAFSDIKALEEEQTALAKSYIASRQSRDVLAERFRVSSGSLFDVISAEDSYFSTAAEYLQSLGELDATRYVLLSRTGRLLDALLIPAAEGTRR